MLVSNTKTLLVFTIFTFLAFLSLANVSVASIYLNVSASPIVQPNTTINVTGSVANTTTSDTLSGINVSANTSTTGNWSVTDSSGFFNFSVTSPSVVGPYNLSIITNSASLINRLIKYTVANETGSTSSIAFSGKFPPFLAGTTFTINITLKNSTGSGLSGITPNVTVYSSNGPQTTWTIANNSASTDSTGLIQFNITIPSGATVGTYVIAVDGGAVFSTFQVGSGYVVAVQTLTTSNEVSSFFSPSSTVSLLAKVRDSNGNSVSGATVTAIVTYPNGTVSSALTLNDQTSSGSAGFYNKTFSDTSASGTYNVKVTATISGTSVISLGIFNTQKFTASLQPQKTFFFEWGGQGAFKPNSTFALDIVPINLTDGSTMIQSSCTSGNYTLLDLAYPNGTSVLNQVYNYSFVSSTSPAGSVCAIKFGNVTGNSNISAGVYGAKINVNLTGESHTITGFFAIQNYFLKVVPVMSLGGLDSFMQVVAPGSNITLALKATNVTNQSAIPPVNITSFTATSILPLMFTSGTNETTSINQTATNGINPSTNPTINMVLPSSMQGPLLIKVQATVAGQTITGNAFVIANYLLGGMSTKAISGGDLGPGGGSGGPGGPGGGGGMLCSGTAQFNGNVQDAATGTAAQGATVVSILQAKEADTGKDVSSFLSVAGATASDSTGSLSANVTFNPGTYSFSGNYFLVFNATYKNVSAGVPGFFQCKNLNIGFPQISTAGSSSTTGFFVSPSAVLNLNLSNVTNMTGSLINSSSTLYITQIFNFNPATGSMKILVNNTPLSASFVNASGIRVGITLYPQNFSVGGVALTQWPNGFFDTRPTVVGITNGASSFVTDSTHGGFMVVAFNAFPESFGFGSVAVGSVSSTVIDIQANGTFNNTPNTWVNTFYSDANNTLVNVTIGRPWEGYSTTLTGVNATLLSDGWNSTADSTNYSIPGGPFERWNITYVIPTTVRKGFAMLTITVNATTNNASSFGQVNVPLGLSVSKYNVVLPTQEGVGDPTNSPFDGFGIQYYPNSTESQNVNQTALGGWNTTYIFTTFGLNSTSQRACVKSSFNSSRFGFGAPQQIKINSTTKVLVLDSSTAGVYDTVILNMTNSTNPGSSTSGVVLVLNTSQRNMSTPTGAGGVYLWEVQNCGYFTVVNTTAAALTSQGSFTQNYGGSHQTNTNFAIPYVVSLGSATSPTFQSGNAVGIKGIVQQNPGRNGGFGFSGRSSAGTDYTVTGATTDANGVAFVTLNVSTASNYMAFWNVTISGDTDAADFSSGTPFDARAFNAFTNVIDGSAVYRVTLLNNANANVFAGGDGIYNGTLATSSGTLFVEYNSINTKFAMRFTGAPTLGSDQFTNQTYNTGGNNYNIAWITPNITTGLTSTNNQTILIYKSANFQTGVVSVRNATQNVTVSLCGQTFFGNPPNPLTAMAVNNITTQDWSQGGSTKTLTIYELMNNTNVTGSGVTAGPSGCALLNVGPGQLSSWPSASGFAPPVFANGYVTNSTNTQQIYVANIFRTG